MGKVYQKPPLVEAVCEFRFTNEKQWDLTLPGLFYNQVKEDFPLKQEHNLFEVQVNMTGAQAEPGITGYTTPRVQFFSENRSRLIQLSPGVLTINHLRPYPNWENYKKLIFEILNKYSQVTNLVGLNRIGLRYINRFDLEENSSLPEYFNYYPFIPQPIKVSADSILLRTELQFPSYNGVLVMTLASIPNDDSISYSYILDFDFVTIDIAGSTITLENCKDWIESAHDQIEKAFEASVTDRLRVTFAEVR